MKLTLRRVVRNMDYYSAIRGVCQEENRDFCKNSGFGAMGIVRWTIKMPKTPRQLRLRGGMVGKWCPAATAYFFCASFFRNARMESGSKPFVGSFGWGADETVCCLVSVCFAVFVAVMAATSFMLQAFERMGDALVIRQSIIHLCKLNAMRNLVEFHTAQARKFRAAAQTAPRSCKSTRLARRQRSRMHFLPRTDCRNRVSGRKAYCVVQTMFFLPLQRVI